MEISKKVSDLARKMDYIGYSIKDRRSIIKDCLNPIGIFLFGENPVTTQIKDSYNFLKKEMDKLEKQRLEYEKSGKKKEEIREIRYIALQN
ncbi:MAG: hypothetical protein AABY32_06855 [Nanoarchaeota archaeon]